MSALKIVTLQMYVMNSTFMLVDERCFGGSNLITQKKNIKKSIKAEEICL